MIRAINRRILVLFICVTFSFTISAQDEVIDRVVGVVGDQIILQSDIENQYIQMKARAAANARKLEKAKAEAAKKMIEQKKMATLKLKEELKRQKYKALLARKKAILKNKVIRYDNSFKHIWVHDKKNTKQPKYTINLSVISKVHKNWSFKDELNKKEK